MKSVWVPSYRLHFNIKDLENWAINLEAELNTSLQFVFYLDDYISHPIHLPLSHFAKV
jgi:hypothetical protein